MTQHPWIVLCLLCVLVSLACDAADYVLSRVFPRWPR